MYRHEVQAVTGLIVSQITDRLINIDMQLSKKEIPFEQAVTYINVTNSHLIEMGLQPDHYLRLFINQIIEDHKPQ